MKNERPFLSTWAARFGLVTALLAQSASASTEEHLTKQFTVQPGGTLVVDVDMGSIEVSAGKDNEVAADVRRKIGRSRKADEEAWLRDNPVEFIQDQNTITIRCRNKTKSWNLIGKTENQVEYKIRVPATFNARVGTAGGGVAVRDLTGEVKANTSAGGLRFSGIKGPLKGTTSGGGIQVAVCDGDINIDTSAGSITLTGGEGSLKAQTSGGSVTVKNFKGPANLETSAGGIAIEAVTGQISAHTSGGGIKASLGSPLAGPIKLDTSAGGITLRLPADTAFDLDAETSAGSVSTEIPVTVVGKHERSELKGSANGGGPHVKLRSSAGSVHILKDERVLAEDPK